MSEKLDKLLKLDISENLDDASLKCVKLDMSVKPDLPDRVEAMESVDIWDMSECPRSIKFLRSSKPVGKFGVWKNPPMSPAEVENDCLTDDVDVELFFTDIIDPSGICCMQDSLTSAASAASERLNLPSGSSSCFDILVVASRLAA